MSEATDNGKATMTLFQSFGRFKTISQVMVDTPPQIIDVSTPAVVAFFQSIAARIAGVIEAPYIV